MITLADDHGRGFDTTGHCRVCGRALRDPLSRARGIGPTCEGKHVRILQRDLFEEGRDENQDRSQPGLDDDGLVVVAVVRSGDGNLVLGPLASDGDQVSKKAWTRIHAASRAATDALLDEKLAAIPVRRPPWWWYLGHLWHFWQIPARREGYIQAHRDRAETQVRRDVETSRRSAEKIGYKKGVHRG